MRIISNNQFEEIDLKNKSSELEGVNNQMKKELEKKDKIIYQINLERNITTLSLSLRFSLNLK